MRIKTFKFKLYQSHKLKKLQRQLDIACNVWNYCVSIQRKYYEREHGQINKFRLMHWLVLLKRKPRYARWNELMADTVRDIIKRIDLSYASFYRNLRQKKKASPPRFISRKNYKSFSYSVNGKGFIKKGWIRINGVWYKFSNWREIEGAPKLITVSKDAVGDFWVSIVCELPDDYPTPDAEIFPAVGLDFGMDKFFTSSDGQCDIDEPKFLAQSLKKLQKKNQALSSTKKDSKNHERARIKVARVHRKITRQRNFFQWQAAAKLVNMYKTICIENLDMHEMGQRKNKKRGKNRCRNIADLAFSSFVEKLKYMAAKKGVRVIEVDQYYPSSQLCSHCGQRDPSMKDTRKRIFQCDNCGLTIDRDKNAAINILNEGLRTLKIHESGYVDCTTV